MPPVALGLTMRLLDDVSDETARLELAAAEDAPPKGRMAKKMRKKIFSGQKMNQVSGP